MEIALNRIVKSRRLAMATGAAGTTARSVQGGSLPELAEVRWRPRASESSLRRTERLWLISTVAHAIELSALSHELDRSLLARLPRPDAVFSVAEYCQAYRGADEHALRQHQRALIREVGAALDRYVRTPMIGAALTMTRQPARLAGFSALQDFLERGFTAFRRMNGAAQFLDIIERRETDLHDAIVGGADDPFPDPWPAPRT